MHFLPGFFVLLLAPEFFRPLRAMGTQYHARMDAIAASERIVDLLETPEPETAADTETLPATRETICFENVHFAYHAGQPALRGIDLTLRRGERVALVGPSGSGKSTVARLLLGLATPDEGRILLDGTDLRLIAPEDWFARISWMPQRPTLFAGSIADNIRLGWPDAPDAAVATAAQAAAAEDFITRLPAGYDTIIGERGQGLSGGEIRRIALARALLKPADLLVLDEAEASLDQATADIIRLAITQLPRATTVLLIAHRLETAAAADRILVLDTGRIVEAGAHAELLARPSEYAAMNALYHEGAL
jgi:ATP-binding cassette subfamily C protein CydD